MKFSINSIVLSILFLCGFSSVSINSIYGKTSQENRSINKPGKYENLIKQGYFSADIYFNAGNEFFEKNDFPRAILNYEKALKISPFNKEINHNLGIARRKIDSPVDVLPDFFVFRWIRNIVLVFLPDSWAVITLFSGFIIVILLFLKWFRHKGLNITWIWILLAIFLISLSASYYRYAFLYKEKSGVLMSSDGIYIAPEERSEKLYDLPAGEKLIITDSLKNWYEIVLINKEKGWIRKDKIEKI